ncbi:MAG: YqaA family protein, partial [Rikenellaceae bacterium]
MEWLVEWGYLGLFISAVIGATVFPLSSEVVLLALLTQPTTNPYIAISCATVGNWVGGMSSYYLGYLGRWDWIERYLGVKREKLEAQSERIKRWGALLALMSWAPVIGDILAVGLGFYRVDFKKSSIYMFIGKGARFIIWALLYYWSKPLLRSRS